MGLLPGVARAYGVHLNGATTAHLTAEKGSLCEWLFSGRADLRADASFWTKGCTKAAKRSCTLLSPHNASSLPSSQAAAPMPLLAYLRQPPPIPRAVNASVVWKLGSDESAACARQAQPKACIHSLRITWCKSVGRSATFARSADRWWCKAYGK